MSDKQAHKPAVPDHAERARALDPRGSFIVQAPAGSGKTELLIQRYLTLLAHVETPNQILAMTFTRKAAGEMQDRVLNALMRAERGDRGETPYDEATLARARAALDNNRRRGWRLLDVPSQLTVQTIDSFCAALTYRLPVTSGVIGGVTREDAAPLYREAARATLDLLNAPNVPAFSNAVAQLLTYFDGDRDRLQMQLEQMLARRDQWLPHVAELGSRDALEVSLIAMREAARNTLAETLTAEQRREWFAVAAYAQCNLGETIAADWLQTAKDWPDCNPSAQMMWSALRSTVLTQKDEPRSMKGLDKRFGFPRGETALEKQIAAEWKQRAGAVIEGVATNADLIAALVLLADLPCHYSDDDWTILHAMATVLKLAAAQLDLVCAARGETDFIAVALAAGRALGTETEPTDLALALDTRLQHMLVDEFQDTSFTQYRLLKQLTAGWQPGDGRTLFLVGDPMQSIYRFRKAEVALFLDTWRHGVGALPLTPITLSANFRSRPAVVDWINSTFMRVLPASSDVVRGAVHFSASVAVRGDADATGASLHAHWQSGNDEEADHICTIVHDAVARERSVAVLVRSRAHVPPIARALHAAGIAFVAVELDSLADRPVVLDIAALARAIAHPADRIAWLSVLRAPWCGLTVQDLTALACSDADGRAPLLLDAMDDAARSSALTLEGRTILTRVLPILREAMALQGRLGLRDAVERAWRRLGGDAIVNEAARPSAEQVFALLDEAERDHTLDDPQRFMAALRRLYAPPAADADARVQIMTIHKAKGLEFDEVIVASLARPTQSTSKPLVLMDELPFASSDGVTPLHAQLVMAPQPRRGEGQASVFGFLHAAEQERERHEMGRLLYVAATRARERLHLTLELAPPNEDKPPRPASRSLAGIAWGALGESFLRELPQAGEGDAATKRTRPAPSTISNIVMRLPVEWRCDLHDREWPVTPAVADATPQATVEFAWAGEQARIIGTLVHRWLQHIARHGIGEWGDTQRSQSEPVIRNQLSAEGVTGAQLEAALARIQTALANTLADDKGRWILAPRRDAASEYAITALSDSEPRAMVIDRWFREEDGSLWIVDFKTGTHEGAGVDAFLDREVERYRAQLLDYRDALGESSARMGLYFPLMKAWREVQGT